MRTVFETQSFHQNKYDGGLENNEQDCQKKVETIEHWVEFKGVCINVYLRKFRHTRYKDFMG